jgi:hypothetical protein
MLLILRSQQVHSPDLGESPQQKEEAMVTFTLVVILVVGIVALGIVAQQRLSTHAAEQFDPERELYQQLLKSAKARTRRDENYDPEWELYQQRYD